MLAAEAGASALLRPSGWIKVFRTNAKQDSEMAVVQRWQREFGVSFDALDPARLRQTEPDLDTSLKGALRYTVADSVTDPNTLVTAYAQYFDMLDGRFFIGDATTLKDYWTVNTQAGLLSARSIVIAMGDPGPAMSRSGSDTPAGRQARLPHALCGEVGCALNHPVLDVENGYLIAPMSRGIRALPY